MSSDQRRQLSSHLYPVVQLQLGLLRARQAVGLLGPATLQVHEQRARGGFLAPLRTLLAALGVNIDGTAAHLKDDAQFLGLHSTLSVLEEWCVQLCWCDEGLLATWLTIVTQAFKVGAKARAPCCPCHPIPPYRDHAVAQRCLGFAVACQTLVDTISAQALPEQAGPNPTSASVPATGSGRGTGSRHSRGRGGKLNGRTSSKAEPTPVSPTTPPTTQPTPTPPQQHKPFPPANRLPEDFVRLFGDSYAARTVLGAFAYGWNALLPEQQPQDIEK